MSGGLFARAVAREVGRDLSVEESEALQQRHGAIYRELLPDPRPLPGAVGLLAALRTVGHSRLVLSACHPLFSAARRIVVYAAQTGVGQPARRLKRRVDEAR